MRKSTKTKAMASEPACPGIKPPTKTSLVIAHLQREQGATTNELIAATGWQPHTTRAALTGLRKKGHQLVRGKRDDETCYHLTLKAL